MIDLKQISPTFSAKFGVAVTIMVLTSACAHEVLVRPSNNDSASISEPTPEPISPATPSTIAETTPTASSRHGKRIAKNTRKGHKLNRLAHNSRAIKHPHAMKAAATVAAAPVMPAPAAPAPEIAPPSLPTPIASAGVQTEIDGDNGNHLGMFTIYGLGALALLGLFYVAPRARRGKPKRKLVFNG